MTGNERKSIFVDIFESVTFDWSKSNQDDVIKSYPCFQSIILITFKSLHHSTNRTRKFTTLKQSPYFYKKNTGKLVTLLIF